MRGNFSKSTSILEDTGYIARVAFVMDRLYALGIICGILYALILKGTKYKGVPVPFVMELPNARFPSAKSIYHYFCGFCGRKSFGIVGRVCCWIQGDFLMIETQNSFHGKGSFKKGIGLSNVKKVAEKYGGAMSIETQENVFVLHVLLIIPQHPENSTQQMD